MDLWRRTIPKCRQEVFKAQLRALVLPIWCRGDLAQPAMYSKALESSFTNIHKMITLDLCGESDGRGAAPRRSLAVIQTFLTLSPRIARLLSVRAISKYTPHLKASSGPFRKESVDRFQLVGVWSPGAAILKRRFEKSRGEEARCQRLGKSSAKIRKQFSTIGSPVPCREC